MQNEHKPARTLKPTRDKTEAHGHTLKSAYGADIVVENERVPDDMKALLGRV
jgi:hypothetical protein